MAAIRWGEIPVCLLMVQAGLALDAWQIEQGLPNNHVTAILHVPGGPLLVGTRAGLVSFDGVSFARSAAWDPAGRFARD